MHPLANKARKRITWRSLPPRRYEARLRGFAAINRVRRGESQSLSAAARAEGTTVRTIRNLLPAALAPAKRGSPIRVKAGDPYSARVEIVTAEGEPVLTIARGSRQRILAGRHRAAWKAVLRKEKPASILDEFKGPKIGGYELLTDVNVLANAGSAGVLDQLLGLYASPGGDGA